MAIAHGLGATARSIGRSARDLEPEHRRDGVGLVLFGLAVVTAAAVWWQLPGAVMEVTRTIAAGSVGKVGWFLPLVLVLIGWRNMRDPVRNGPAGRQVIGWAALAFCVLGIVHIGNGNPQPVSGDTDPLETAGGAVGFVVSNLLLDLMRTPYVVVPLLVLLGFFGVLVITATPVYQVPTRLAELRDRLLGRSRPDTEGDEGEPTQPIRTRRGRSADGDIDPDMGDPAYDSPVLEDREVKKRRKKGQPDPEAETDAFAAVPGARSPPEPRRPTSSRRRTRRCRHGSSSSRCPATSPTRCPPTRCSSPGRCTRHGPRPVTPSSTA